jgi:hypothetical protein
MSRRGQPVPEAAPLLGLVLAFGIAGFGFRFGPPGSHLATAAVALVVLYGFTAYGIARSPDPVDAIPPDPVLAGGALLAALAVGYGVFVGQPMAGVLVGLVAAVPPVAYHARFGERRNPLSPNRTFLAAVAVALLLVVAGAFLADLALAALTGGLLVLAAADYRDARGDPLGDLAEFALVAAAFGGAALAVLYFTLVADRPAVGLLAGTALVAVGAYFALGAERVARSGRRRRPR